MTLDNQLAKLTGMLHSAMASGNQDRSIDLLRMILAGRPGASVMWLHLANTSGDAHICAWAAINVLNLATSPNAAKTFRIDALRELRNRLGRRGRTQSAFLLARRIRIHPRANLIDTIRACELGNLVNDTAWTIRITTQLKRNRIWTRNLATVAGLARLQADDHFGAKNNFTEAVLIHPGDVLLMTNLQSAQTGSSDRQRLVLARRLVTMAPVDSHTLDALGTSFLEAGNRLNASLVLRKALVISPDASTIISNLAHVSEDNWQEGFRRALVTDPTNITIIRNLADVLVNRGEMVEARQTYLEGADTSGSLALRIKAAVTCPAIYNNRQEIQDVRARIMRESRDIQNSRKTLDDPLAEVGVANFYLAYHGEDDKELMAQIAGMYLTVCRNLDWTAPHCKSTTRRKGRIRIGFISRFFYEHSVRFFTEGFVRYLDRDRFELCLISDRPENETSILPKGEHPDRFLEIDDDLEKAREDIADLELDTLVYCDIGMEPLTYFLAFSRLARFQVLLQGHPVTSGIPNIDAYISNELQEDQNAAMYYSEELIRLPGIPVCLQEIPAPRNFTRQDFGLPDAGALYFCPQTLYKLHPDFDEVLKGILERDPDGHILLVMDKRDAIVTALKNRLDATLGELANRIIWVKRMPRNRYYAMLKLSDAILDTLHFCGGVTTIQALGLGAPVVTMPTQFFRGRMTLCWYKVMDIHELVANSVEEYCDIAVRLGRDRKWQQMISDRIVERQVLLFDRTDSVRAFEEVVLKACEDRQ